MLCLQITNDLLYHTVALATMLEFLNDNIKKRNIDNFAKQMNLQKIFSTQTLYT